MSTKALPSVSLFLDYIKIYILGVLQKGILWIVSSKLEFSLQREAARNNLTDEKIMSTLCELSLDYSCV